MSVIVQEGQYIANQLFSCAQVTQPLKSVIAYCCECQIWLYVVICQFFLSAEPC